MSIWFVTPAWHRYEMSAICFEQRRRVIAKLAEWGHEAHCVVVADDANLDIARELGFATVKQDNRWLGRKFNDGIEYAYRHGAQWVVPIGSDSWIDPWYFRELPPDVPDVVRTSRLYAPVEANRLAILEVGGDENPAGPHMFHRDLLAKRPRPMPDKISQGTDHHTLRSLRPFHWQFQNVQRLQYIGFRAPPFITKYDNLWQKWGVKEYDDPWVRLAKVYDADLVERAERVMRLQPSVATLANASA